MVSVDRVYQTVQKILNKEQRGYLPPVEFNLFANQAQIEVFEEYFYDLDLYMRGGNDSDFADIARNTEEKIAMFEVTSGIITEDAADTFNYPSDFYRLGRVLVSSANGAKTRIADEVSNKDITYINLSKLTSPTTKQPVYVRSEGGVVIHPIDGLLDTDEVRMVYIKEPSDVEWAYITVSGTPNFNASSSTDFEVHQSDLPDLILKVCALAGVAIRAIDVTQIVQGEEAALDQAQKQ